MFNGFCFFFDQQNSFSNLDTYQLVQNDRIILINENNITWDGDKGDKF